MVPIIHEVFGGWGWRATRLFRQMARGRAPRADSIDAAESSWAARSFTAFHAQRISVAIQVRSAAEILRNLRTTTTELARAAHRRRERVRPGTRHCVPGAAAAQAAAPPFFRVGPVCHVAVCIRRTHVGSP